MAENALRQAIKNYQVKNYREAFTQFKKLAKNTTEAQYYLGLMYFYGQSTSVDYHLAFKYFKNSWEGLYANATYMLGVCYEQGKGIEKDLFKAFEYYQAAGKQESQLALLKVAKFYEEGIVVKKSMKTAIEIYVNLSKKKNAYSMYKIGTFYLEGNGLKKSMDNAFTWLNKALAAGSQEAMNYFRFLGSKSKNDIRTTEEIYNIALSHIQKEAYEESIILLEIASKEKHIEAIIKLSDAYLNGLGVKQSASKAFKTLLKYKDLNDPTIEYIIGQKYEHGEGVDSSFIKAALFYELAAKKNHQSAITALKEIRGY